VDRGYLTQSELEAMIDFRFEDGLKALGGRFNPKLTNESRKRAGWILSKAREQGVRNLLTVK
jgi:hypothetical protein